MTTTLTRRGTHSDLFRDRMSRLFDDAFGDFLAPLTATSALSTREWMPPVDIRETPEALSLVVEIPGLTREDVQITVENNVLSISGERKFEKEIDEQSYHRIERAYGKFSRSFTLPSNVEMGKVGASFKDGLLTVVLPKMEEAKPRRIEIR